MTDSDNNSQKGEKVLLFTRTLENVSKQFPEVTDYIKNM